MPFSPMSFQAWSETNTQERISNPSKKSSALSQNANPKAGKYPTKRLITYAEISPATIYFYGLVGR